MKNKYNLNIINMIKNEELYINNIFQILLKDSDVQELKSESFSVSSYGKKNTITTNIEGFLYGQEKYLNEESSDKKEMIELFKEYYKKELLEPLYFTSIKKKNYVLTINGFECYQNPEKYFKNLVLKKKDDDNKNSPLTGYYFEHIEKSKKELSDKIEKSKVNYLNDTEEKYIIDCIFEEGFKINLNKEKDIDSIDLLFNVFWNQKEYLNKKNDKSQMNLFYENRALKEYLSLFSEEQRNSIINENIDCKSIINLYFSKLLKQNHFDLVNQLRSYSSKEVLEGFSNYLDINKKEKENNKNILLFKPFLEKGTSISIHHLEALSQGSPIPMSGIKKKSYPQALKQGIDLFIKLKDELSKDERLVKIIFVAIINANSMTNYLKLREHINLPTGDEKFNEYLDMVKINGKTVSHLEKEHLMNKLEKSLDEKKIIKKTKI